MQTIRFKLNGAQIEARDVDPNTTLLSWLRQQGLTGTKEGCSEGECGACAVLMLCPDGAGASRYQPLNSCLLLLASAADRELLSVEGIHAGAAGSFEAAGPLGAAGPHPVQQAMIATAGSQCGYCTPGFVVSLFAEYYRKDREATGFDRESVGGNLCRCTGYRPIVSAGHSLPVVQPADAYAARLSAAPPKLKPLELSYTTPEAQERLLFRPTQLSDAVNYLADHPDAVLISGGTDVVVELNQRHRRLQRALLLEGVEGLHGISRSEAHIEIGAGVSLGEIEAELSADVPIFGQLLPLFSSRLIRARATLGGNLATASPIGDSPPVLLALSAELVLVSKRGQRSLPLAEFFLGYRQTARAADEIIRSVRIPLPLPTLTKFYKVSKREQDDISTVAAAFALDLEGEEIKRARLCFGGVAATPARASAAEAQLIGCAWDRASLDAALPTLAAAFKPLSDQRGSLEYRQRMLTKLFEKFWFETANDSPRAGQSEEPAA